MYCPNCGAEMHDGEKFCGNCGARLDATPAQDPAPKSAESASVSAAQQQALPTSQPAQASSAGQFQTQFQEAFRPQSVQEASWAEVTNGARSQASAFASEAKAKSTPYAVAALIGKVIALIALFMPCVASPILKQYFATTSSSSIAGFNLSTLSSMPVIGDLIRGEWSMLDFHGIVDLLNRYVTTASSHTSSFGGFGGVSTLSGNSITPSTVSALNTAVIITNVGLVVWALMIAALIFSIVRPLIKADKLTQLENKYNLDMIIMLTIAALTLLWCVLVIVANATLENYIVTSSSDSTATLMFVLGHILEVPVAPWVVIIASALTAFWPRLSKHVGLSK